jgi:hypothetical protein
VTSRKDNSTKSFTQVAVTQKPVIGKEIQSPYSSIGKDVIWYVSGSIDGTTPENKAVAVFGGDVVVSGSLRVEGGELAGSFNFDVDVLELTGSLEVQGNGIFTTGITGSLTRLPDGGAFIAGAGGVSISTASNGQVVVFTNAIEWNERVGYGDGSSKIFSLSYEPADSQSVMLFVNGVLQERDEETADFHIEGSTITFNYTPEASAKITATYAKR